MLPKYQDSDEVTNIRRAMEIANARKKTLMSLKDNLSFNRKSSCELQETVDSQAKRILELEEQLKNQEIIIRDDKITITKLHVDLDNLRHQHEVFSSQLTKQSLEIKSENRLLKEEIEKIKGTCLSEARNSLNIIQSFQSSNHHGISLVLNGIISSLNKSFSNCLEVCSNGKETLPTPSTDEKTLLELCDYLESENQKLAQLGLETRQSLSLAKKEASVLHLIPHYRMAITRARKQVNSLQIELAEEKEANAVLREQLSLSYRELKKFTESSLKSKEMENGSKTKLTRQEIDRTQANHHISDLITYCNQLESDLKKRLQKSNQDIGKLADELKKVSKKETKKLMKEIILAKYEGEAPSKKSSH